MHHKDDLLQCVVYYSVLAVADPETSEKGGQET